MLEIINIKIANIAVAEKNLLFNILHNFAFNFKNVLIFLGENKIYSLKFNYII